jgi:hypothetical protein
MRAMEETAGEAHEAGLRLSFDRRIKLEFLGSKARKASCTRAWNIVSPIAVYVELELCGSCIANADRSRALKSRLILVAERPKDYRDFLI